MGYEIKEVKSQRNIRGEGLNDGHLRAFGIELLNFKNYLYTLILCGIQVLLTFSMK
jgi:hypothetical protein